MRCRVRGVIRQGDKLFLVQHKGSTTWCLPGGGIDEGEQIISALKREIQEELGVQAEVGQLLVVHQFQQNGIFAGPEFFFAITNPEDFASVDLAATSHGSAEIAKAAFRDPKTTEGILPDFLASLPVRQTGVQVVIDG